MIDVSHVTMQFNMANDKIISLKETVVALLRGKLKYKKFTALDDVSFSVEPGGSCRYYWKERCRKKYIIKKSLPEYYSQQKVVFQQMEK